MKLFSNWKISVKLIVTFLIIALIAAGVGIYGIFSLSRQNEISKSSFDHYGNSQGYLGYVLGDFNNQRMLLGHSLISVFLSHSKIDTDMEKLDSVSKDLSDNLKKYNDTCITAEEKTQYTNIETALNAFSEVRDKIVKALKSANYSEAKTVLFDDSTEKTFNNVETVLEDAVAANVTNARNEYALQDSANKTSMVIMIAVVTLAILIAVLNGIFMTRMITKPLKRMAKGAVMLSQGVTEIGEMNINTRDEIGDMYKSFSIMVEAIKALVSDANMLAEAAMEGRLSVRADAAKHQGDFYKIVEGFNGTLDAIVKPVNEATVVLSEIESGNLSARINSAHHGDYAVIREKMNSMADILKSYINEITYNLGEISKGNFNIEITSEFKGDFNEIKESINEIIDSLNKTMDKINTVSEQVTSGARQVSDGAQETSQGATEQASSIEELTSTITQIAEQTKHNAMSANKANELTVSAVSEAERGNERMKAMQKAMSEISDSSRNISKIIKVIDDIAFQTNILALNAAVEAARAGVHGKGFAVVADEVRNLAAKSANAAKETTDLIEGSIKKTEAGTKIADETANVLSSIVEGVDKAAKIVSEIARASNEQAGAIAQVNRGIEQMSQVVQTNSATAEEGAAAAEELSSQSELLKNMVSQFQLKGYTKIQRYADTASESQMNEGMPDKEMAIDLSDSDFGKY